jgi:AcrR family transcriptional regulator
MGPVADPRASASHRDRLLAGLGASIAEKGYAATTVADVARHARVSKRTFYEHFEDRGACLEALCLLVTDRMLDVIERSREPDRPWSERLDAALGAYLRLLADNPALTRTLLMELQAAGPGALRARREAYRRYTEQLCRLTEQAAREEEGLRPLTPALATAVIGGINELMLEAVEAGRIERLPDLLDDVTDLIRSVVMGGPRA